MSNLNLANYLMAGIALVLSILCYLTNMITYSVILGILCVCCIVMLIANYRKERKNKAKHKFHVTHKEE